MGKQTSTTTPVTRNKFSRDKVCASADLPHLNAGLSQQVSRLLVGACKSLPWSYSIPVAHLAKCAFCGKIVAPVVLADDQEINVEIFLDDVGVTRLEFSAPHRCARSIRYADFLRESIDEDGR